MICPNCGAELEEYDTVQNRCGEIVGTIWTCSCTNGYWHDVHGDLEDWYY